jgi:hypothetical protein
MKIRILFYVLMFSLFSCVQDKDRPHNGPEKKARTYAQTTDIPKVFLLLML